ncbi:MAG: hypothetical protein IPP94_05145 [Ignavibacteria bacterium]|nr:hypothetical protein [Ignavibacteria bacterium]
MTRAAADITLGSRRYETHASEVLVTLGLLPGAGSFRASFPVRTEFSAAPGDEAVLKLDGGDGPVDVLTGAIALLRRGLLSIDVTGADAGSLLGAVRSATTFERQEASQIINALVSDAGASAGRITINLPLACYVAHQTRTSAEHVSSIASMGGCMAVVDADGTVAVRAFPARPDIALRYGREIISYRSIALPAPRSAEYLIGNGPAGSIQAPNALHPSFERLPGSAPAPGPDSRWRPAPVLRTAATASDASSAASARGAAASSRIHATCFLLPAMRPGMVADVQDLPDGPSGGPWLIVRVRHHLHPSTGATTTFEGVAADGGSFPGGLLGAGLSALGGL